MKTNFVQRASTGAASDITVSTVNDNGTVDVRTLLKARRGRTASEEAAKLARACLDAGPYAGKSCGFVIVDGDKKSLPPLASAVKGALKKAGKKPSHATTVKGEVFVYFK